MYDCEMKLDIQGIKDFEGVEGKIKVNEVTNHTSDDEFEVRPNLI